MHLTVRAIFIIFICHVSGISADTKENVKYPFKPSDFTVTALNSPVKEQFARFHLNIPTAYDPDKIKIKVVNTNDLFKDKSQFSNASLVGTELRIPVNKLPPGFYRLYVKLKDKKEEKETLYTSTLHDFVRFSIDESLEVAVPDPKTNNASLAGVDSDNNGIRDDVQRFITQTYPNENVKLALKQVARAWQTLLINVKDKESAKYYTDKQAETKRCLLSKTPQWAELGRQIETLTLNTEARIKKSLERDGLIHGHSTPESIINFQSSGLKNYDIFCEF